MKTLGKRAAGARLERMKASPLWLGEGFRNVHPVLEKLRDRTVKPPIGDFFFGGPRRAPKRPLPSVDPRDGWSRRVESGLRATWLGHSTVLLEIDGARVLTDPVWGERVSPVGFAGPKRYQPVPIEIESLPALDAVVISHDHYDHLDYPSILRLAKANVPFVTSLGVGAHLEAWGVPAERIVELDWWESTTLPRTGLTITAAPSQHFSGRGPGSRNATLWSSFAMRGARNAVFFSGDTGLTTEYQEIARRLGPFDLAMLEVGAFHPSWGDIHLGPENALEALALLGSPRLLPVHWGTFSLAVHDWDEPAETLITMAAARDVQLVMPRLGESIEPVRAERVSPWWREARESLVPDAPEPVSDEATSAAGEAPLEWPID